MAEESVKRATGVSPIYPVIPDMSTVSLPFSGSGSTATSDTAIPVHGDSNRFLQVLTHAHGVALASATAAHMGRSVPMQRVSPEHLQKPASGGPSSCSPIQWKTATWSPETSASDK